MNYDNIIKKIYLSNDKRGNKKLKRKKIKKKKKRK